MGLLEGRVAVVTGASRGIGEFIAKRFAQEGAAVAVTARTEKQTDERLPGTIHATVEAITQSGGKAVAIAADLSKPGATKHIVDQTERQLGPIDILVNNAAVTWFIDVAGFPESRYRVMFEVQVRSTFELSQLVMPGMKQRGHGHILNISSGAAMHPSVENPRGGMATVYGMCKAAIERFSTGLAAELYNDNIAVNALSPTKVVPTPGVLLHTLIPEDAPDDVAEGPEVMAEAALALCSREPRSLTGRIAYSQELLAELGIPMP